MIWKVDHRHRQLWSKWFLVLEAVLGLALHAAQEQAVCLARGVALRLVLNLVLRLVLQSVLDVVLQSLPDQTLWSIHDPVLQLAFDLAHLLPLVRSPQLAHDPACQSALTSTVQFSHDRALRLVLITVVHVLRQSVPHVTLPRAQDLALQMARHMLHHVVLLPFLHLVLDLVPRPLLHPTVFSCRTFHEPQT